MELRGNWNYPTSVRFGVGRVSELADACAALGMRRPLLVTDRGLAALGVVATALGHLAAGGLGEAVFSGVDPNPTGANLDAGLKAYRDGGHDGVVAFGGGSALDLGKAIAFMSGQDRPVWDFEDVDDWWTRADPAGIDPIVAVPTTAGTGSEVGRASVLTNEATHEKKIIFHPRLLPGIVICDPALTVGLPPRITAGTGMDAFAHCLEAYCSPHFHPMSQGDRARGDAGRGRVPRARVPGTGPISKRARRCSRPRRWAPPRSRRASARSTRCRTRSGRCTARITARPTRPSWRRCWTSTARRSRAGSRPRRATWAWPTSATPRRAASTRSRERVVALNEALGIPRTLTELGVADPDLEALTVSALADPSVGGNPVPMTAANVRALLGACL